MKDSLGFLRKESSGMDKVEKRTVETLLLSEYLLSYFIISITKQQFSG